MGEAGIVSELFLERLNYCIYVILLSLSLWAMLAKRNLIKKLIGMFSFPNCNHSLLCIHRGEGRCNHSHLFARARSAWYTSSSSEDKNESLIYLNILMDLWYWKWKPLKGCANPLPHVLMLTAIVVGVATLGLALSINAKNLSGIWHH